MNGDVNVVVDDNIKCCLLNCV